MKTLFYVALAASFVCVATSCVKEHAVSKSAAPVAFTPSHPLTFVKARIVHAGDTVELTRADTNTAYISSKGDTAFPRWYYKERSAAVAAVNGRTLGTNDITIDYGHASIPNPVKHAPGLNVTIGIVSDELYRSAMATLQMSDGSMPFPWLEVDNIDDNDHVGDVSFRLTNMQCGDSYTPVFQTYTSDPNSNDMVWHESVHPFYIYSWQDFLGQGTSYGADMKIVNLLGEKTSGDLLAVIANRSSQSVNGISYLFYEDVAPNANSTGHTPLITLPMQSSSFAPKGAAAAVTLRDDGWDLILATYTRTSSESAYSIKYLYGKNINTGTGAATWAQPANAPITIPGFGDDVVDIGIAVSDMDNNGVPDLVVSGVSPTKILYRIGYNMDANGNADFSSPVQVLNNNVSGSVIGGGFDSDGHTFVANYYTNGSTSGFINFIYNWDVNTQKFTLTYAYGRETVGQSGAGAGVSIYDIDQDFNDDILTMAYIGGDFRFMIDYDYDPFDHKELTHGICGAHTN